MRVRLGSHRMVQKATCCACAVTMLASEVTFHLVTVHGGNCQVKIEPFEEEEKQYHMPEESPVHSSFIQDGILVASTGASGFIVQPWD
jgi:hypothetical protein